MSLSARRCAHTIKGKRVRGKTEKKTNAQERERRSVESPVGPRVGGMTQKHATPGRSDAPDSKTKKERRPGEDRLKKTSPKETVHRAMQLNG